MSWTFSPCVFLDSSFDVARCRFDEAMAGSGDSVDVFVAWSSSMLLMAASVLLIAAWMVKRRRTRA